MSVCAHQHTSLSAAGRPRENPLTATESQQQQAALHFGQEWVLLHLDRPLLALPGTMLICTKLDLDYEQADPSCRIMFSGNIVHLFKREEECQQLKLFKVCHQHVQMESTRCMTGSNNSPVLSEAMHAASSLLHDDQPAAPDWVCFSQGISRPTLYPGFCT